MTDHVDHVAAIDLERFARGELTGDALAAFETHVAGCATCGEALAREARLELALFELGSRQAVPRAPRWRPVVRAVATVAALAAVVALVAAGRDGGARSVDVDRSARPICADAACAEHREPLAYPSWAGPPLLDRPPRGGPSNPPFQVASRDL
jgi:hypothetical protein